MPKLGYEFYIRNSTTLEKYSSFDGLIEPVIAVDPSSTSLSPPYGRDGRYTVHWSMWCHNSLNKINQFMGAGATELDLYFTRITETEARQHAPLLLARLDKNKQDLIDTLFDRMGPDKAALTRRGLKKYTTQDLSHMLGYFRAADAAEERSQKRRDYEARRYTPGSLR